MQPAGRWSLTLPGCPYLAASQKARQLERAPRLALPRRCSSPGLHPLHCASALVKLALLPAAPSSETLRGAPMLVEGSRFAVSNEIPALKVWGATTQAVLQMLSVTSGTTALARWRTPTPCSQMACIPFVQRPPRRPNRALTSPLTSTSQRLHLVQSRHLIAQYPPTLHVVAITVSCVPSSSSRTITHKLLVRAPRRSTISMYQAT